MSSLFDKIFPPRNDDVRKPLEKEKLYVPNRMFDKIFPPRNDDVKIPLKTEENYIRTFPY
jgi:hypothetical protein